MRLVLAAAVLGLVAGCSHEYRSFKSEDIVLLKREGLSDEDVLRRVREPDAVLFLTAEDAPSLRDAGMRENYVNALLSLAAEPRSRPAEPQPQREKVSGHQH